MKTYICTCGTSVLTKSGINIERFRNAPVSSWALHSGDIEGVRESVFDRLESIELSAQLDDTSAEIKSLVKMGVSAEDRVVLIASDTVDGKLCAELVATFLRERAICSDITIKSMTGLQAKDGQLFQREGLKNLLAYLVSLEHEEIILNPTGGFKSVVPYMALIGMLFNKPVRYIHEDSNDVITLANVPVLLDDHLLLQVEDKLRKIEKDSSISCEDWQEGLDYNDRRFDSLIEVLEGEITLSGLGLLFWERFKIDYPEELFREVTTPESKFNKLLDQGIGHHGLEKLKPIAAALLQSPFVKGIPNSCENQPKSRSWIKALSSEEAKRHLQHSSAAICLVTNTKSDAGYSFLVETTARNMAENEQIAEILKRKYFN